MFGLILFLLFVGVPAAEIAIFIVVGGEIGVWSTIALVILTAIAGSALIRRQGLRTLIRAQHTLSRSELPIEEAFDGICLVAAGALLLTPGFLTDTIGLLLLVPPLRAMIRGPILRRLQARMTVRGFGAPPPPPPPDDGPIIDGDFHEVDPRPNTDQGGPRLPGSGAT
ncbi:MAG: FxsA family protein [Proteobacteria bacterium]|nr:FxsA family protein [Pseudomonadota bacterium]MDA1057818.1 FxsA family protein [Pseudomonadota bacterium]